MNEREAQKDMMDDDNDEIMEVRDSDDDERDLPGLPPERVVEVWGDGFEDITKHPRITYFEDKIEISLHHPFFVKKKYGNTAPVKETVDKITLMDPTVSDMMAMDEVKGDVAKAARFLESCAGLPGTYVAKMRGRDFLLVQKVLGAFLYDGSGTGRT